MGNILGREFFSLVSEESPLIPQDHVAKPQRHLGVSVSSGLTFDRRKSRNAVKTVMFGTCEAFRKNAFPLSRSHCAVTKHFNYVFTTIQASVCCTSEDRTTPHKAKTFKRAFGFHSTGSNRYRSERH
jgi:hypothetical protein